jgi:MoaA/NifB/PqqE/SkfB family radical SAM enzyme
MNTFSDNGWASFRQAFHELTEFSIRYSRLGMRKLGIAPPPFRLQVDLTDRCNFRCPTCSKWKSADPERELNAGEWKSIFRKVKSLILFRELTVCGGEPFLHPEILEILVSARKEGFSLTVITNGWLVDEDLIHRLEEIGVGELRVSLNSLHEDVHDRSRGMPGSFRRIMSLLENRWNRYPGTEISLATTIMEDNIGELSRMVTFARGKGLKGIIFQSLAPPECHYSFASGSKMPAEAPWTPEGDFLWVRNDQRLEKEVERVVSLKRKGFPVVNPVWQLRAFPTYYRNPDAVRKMACTGTLTRMNLDPFGDIRLCYGYPPVGNALTEDPGEAWRGTEALSVRLDSRYCPRLCRLLNNNL